MRINELLIVEGKYDAAKLAGIVDGLILTTGGFSIYKDEEKRELIRTLGKKRGIIILTDSDAAGFRIRNYIQNFARGAVIKHAYVPAVTGKEARKNAPSKEGTLGVEGLPNEVILEALRRAGATPEKARAGRAITYTDLFALGLSGTSGSAARRQALLKTVGMPTRLSKKALLETLNATYTYEELAAIAKEKPVLFWDFHGTLIEPDHAWADAAYASVRRRAPDCPVTLEQLYGMLHHRCLPWWMDGVDTRALAQTPGAWWRFVNEEFAAVYRELGFDAAAAAELAREMRPAVTAPAANRLKPDAVAVLAQLQKRGYRQYILSNNFPELPTVVTALGLDPYLSGVMVSVQAGFDKPDPAFFQYALAQAGNPDQAVMIGDNPTDDMAGAKAVGWGTLGVGRAAACPQADAGSETLTGLLDILA